MALNLDYAPGTTPLDPDELEGLIPAHITTRGELDPWEASNILKAEKWLLDARPKDILSLDFIKQLHKRMFDETWKWAGNFRTTEKNIGVDPAQIAPRTKDLCEDVRAQLTYKGIPIDETAAMLHHRLVSIHPFANGNGRHARLITDVLLMRNGAERFKWGEDDLVADTEVRRRYITALQAADRRDYKPLFAFVRQGGVLKALNRSQVPAGG
ncbi:MAG: mobile mystery protein [Burkholderiales bacterium]|nr:mobile mystery protein [Burkholderiales bacterium]